MRLISIILMAFGLAVWGCAPEGDRESSAGGASNSSNDDRQAQNDADADENEGRSQDDNSQAADDDDDSDDDNSGSGDDDDGDGATLTYFEFARDVLAKECANCHGVPSSQGAPATFRLDTYNETGGLPGAFAMSARIKERIEDGSMPPEGVGSLSNEEAELLVNWVDQGALEGNGGDARPTPPTIKLLTPATGNTDINETFTFTVAIENADANARWAIFVGTSPQPSNAQGLLVSLVLAATTTYTWNSSNAPRGTKTSILSPWPTAPAHRVTAMRPMVAMTTHPMKHLCWQTKMRLSVALACPPLDPQNMPRGKTMTYFEIETMLNYLNSL